MSIFMTIFFKIFIPVNMLQSMQGTASMIIFSPFLLNSTADALKFKSKK